MRVDQVNIWQDIECDKVGLVDKVTLHGAEQLLRQWLTLPADERNEMAARARASFVRRYAMNRAAIAINDVFTAARAMAMSTAR